MKTSAFMLLERDGKLPQEVLLKGTLLRAERQTFWHPGCAASMEDVCATTEDGAEVPLTPAEEAEAADILLNSLEDA